MYKGKKVVVVLPAYNAAKTLKTTCDELDMSLVDELVLVDDNSTDNTEEVARAMGIQHVIRHDVNRGYGGNQKTCYNHALALGADIVVMVHPDYQYTPKLLPAMVALLECGLYDAVFASRILGKGALKGGMPLYKYVANRALTFAQNVLMNQKLSEYHTGYRAYSREVLEQIDYAQNSDDFIFDNEIVAQIFAKGYDIAEVTCPTKYFADGSSINFPRSMKYGFGVLGVSVRYFLHKTGVFSWEKLRATKREPIAVSIA
ncbi:glycosyltransferase family 2 protein [Hymenobacter sp. DG01]|uniref:glycosyltransferase family 2 protein n=1 Tax=Hymenobacter sp. DG01 TaxID=2584940 RepID=UPI001124A7DA|nr:glycosyltransferase family 2 protein [Hymenobacter sp. DG01]